MIQTSNYDAFMMLGHAIEIISLGWPGNTLGLHLVAPGEMGEVT